VRDERIDRFGPVLVKSSHRQGQGSSGVNHIVDENRHLKVEIDCMGAVVTKGQTCVSYLVSHVANQQFHLFGCFRAAHAPLPVNKRKIEPELVGDGSNPGDGA
jgi:hypothetical protein